MDLVTYAVLNKKIDAIGNIPDEKITEAVNTYLDENPPTTGATAEQVAQINKNVADIDELKSDIGEYVYTVKDDVFIGEYGGEKSDSGHCATDYIRINYGVRVLTYIGNSNARHAFYDKDKKFISSESDYQHTGVMTALTVPENAYYIRVSCYKNQKNLLRVEQNTVYNSIDKTREHSDVTDERVNALENESATAKTEICNLRASSVYVVSEFVNGKYNNYGDLITGTTRLRLDDFIHLYAGDYVEVNGIPTGINMSLSLFNPVTKALISEGWGANYPLNVSREVLAMPLFSKENGGDTISPSDVNGCVITVYGSSERLISYDRYGFSNVQYRDGIYISKYAGSEGNYATDTESCSTDYIPVIPNTRLKITNVYLSGNRTVAFYDISKHYVSLITPIESSDTTVIADIPNNARYVRATGRSGKCPTFEYISDVTKENVDTFTKANGYTNLFENATNKPVVSIIDDDTWGTQYVTWLKNKCDDLGIKISFACLTSRFAEDAQLKDTLLSFERQGFPILLHGYTQGTFYKPSPDRDFVACEDDFVHGLQDLHKAGFTDYKACWVTPYGRYDDELKKLAIKWGMESLVRYSPEEQIEDYSRLNPMHRYELFRYEYDTEDNENTVKALIDKCAESNGWFLFGVHSAQPANQTDAFKASFERVVNYAKSKGCEIRTLNEELRRRMPIYNNVERF